MSAGNKGDIRVLPVNEVPTGSTRMSLPAGDSSELTCLYVHQGRGIRIN